MKTSSSKNTRIDPPGLGASLSWLIASLEYSLFSGSISEELTIHSFSSDSRSIEQGDLFVAITGTHADGHAYIQDALTRGAVAVIVENTEKVAGIVAESTVPIIVAADARKAYAEIAERYYGNPANGLKLIGITGTNGKTTITYVLEEILNSLGCLTGVIGTVNYRFDNGAGKTVLPAANTTPGAKELQELLFLMRSHGVQYVMMEVSSHSLVQQRLGQLQFDVAAFTNLSHDHLDYHATMEEYFQAKNLLFTRHLKADGTAVISTPIQDKEPNGWSERLRAVCSSHHVCTLCCGETDHNDVQLTGFSSDLGGSQIAFRLHDQEHTFKSKLVGQFNIDNLLTACTVMLADSHSPAEILPHLPSVKGAPGRLERIEHVSAGQFDQPVVFVDYAHTPDAVRQVLLTLSALPHTDLFCVFGCGGDRDRRKRPVMGRIAIELADVVCAASDNPRTEDPVAILGDIEQGMVDAGGTRREVDWLLARAKGEKGYSICENRSLAIRQTVAAAGAGDIVVILGKGHENYQITQSGKRFFDDRLEAQNVMTSWHLHTVQQAIAGKVVSSGKVKYYAAVSTDTRTLRKGDIFVALKGERFDGNDHLQEALAKGAACCIVEEGRSESSEDAAILEVVDGGVALSRLAHFRRKQLDAISNPSVVAITGSCGKTTVKEMVSAILKAKWAGGVDYPPESVLHTRGNLNNLIGLPLSLLPLTVFHKAAVLEMGMNAFGEIAQMVRVAEPDISCITNVHGVHLEGLGSIEGVARAKEELFAGTPAHGTLIVNLDDPHIREFSKKYPHQKIYFGTQPAPDGCAPDFWATDVVIDESSLSFMLHTANDQIACSLPALGQHNIVNALAAAATAYATGATFADIAQGLADFRTADKRMVKLCTPEHLTLLNDSYNANPASMEAALQTLKHLAGVKKSLALLGDMFELGDHAEKAHKELGRQAAEMKITYLAAVGQFASLVTEGAIEAGMAKENVFLCRSKEAVSSCVQNLVQENKISQGDYVLVKASRGMKMETLVDSLMKEC